MGSILLIRHGNTPYDTRIDALLDPPLDEAGVERVRRTIDFVREGPFRLKRVISSPKQRCLQLAERLSDGSLRVTTSSSLRAWDLGDFMGKEFEAVKDKILFLEHHPFVVPPHGEPYMKFYRRWERFLVKCMQYIGDKPEDLVLVTHSRNINALQSLVGGSRIGHIKPSTPEASVTLLYRNGLGDWDYKPIWEGK